MAFDLYFCTTQSGQQYHGKQFSGFAFQTSTGKEVTKTQLSQKQNLHESPIAALLPRGVNMEPFLHRLLSSFFAGYQHRTVPDFQCLLSVPAVHYCRVPRLHMQGMYPNHLDTVLLPGWKTDPHRFLPVPSQQASVHYLALPHWAMSLHPRFRLKIQLSAHEKYTTNIRVSSVGGGFTSLAPSPSSVETSGASCSTMFASESSFIALQADSPMPAAISQADKKSFMFTSP